ALVSFAERRVISMMNKNEDGIQMLVTVQNASKVLCQYCGNYELCDLCQVSLLLEQVDEKLYSEE
ncbi:hypothetical protein, partial [[Ruminococcus] lactaris]